MRKLDEQRYLWLFRVFGIFLVISIFFNIILYLSFDKISPTVKREAFFVSSENDNTDVIYVTKTLDNFEIEQNSVGYSIAQSYISQYIIDRESLFSSRKKMQDLWGTRSNLFFFSSRKLYENFINSDYYKTYLINKDKKIIIANLKSLPLYQPKSKEWTAVVELKITDFNGLNPIFETKNIRIKADFIKKNRKLNLENEWKNPLGFEITEYQYVN